MPFIAKRVYHKKKIISSKKREDKKMIRFSCESLENDFEFSWKQSKEKSV